MEDVVLHFYVFTYAKGKKACAEVLLKYCEIPWQYVSRLQDAQL